MSRIRLTNRTRKGAEFADFPGTVNQPDRKDPKYDKYHTFEHTVNHELPDMRTEWKDNPRDEIGFGVPKVAHIWATAQKAVKLATLFLGDKCNDKVIEAQARDFMRLGSRRIEFALKRFATTEELYKAEEELEVEAESNEEVVEETPVETAEMNEVQKMGEDKKEEAPVVVEEKKEASKVVAEVKIEKPVVKAEEEKTEEIEDKEAGCKAEETEEIVDEDEEITADVEEEDENEINMTPADEDVELTDEEEKTLSSVFADDDADEDDSEETVVEASKKKVGVKKLGGQPKVASKKSDDISSVWSDAPDVSHIFN